MNPQNLLFILSDQHNPQVMGCAGHPMVRTPNIDRLASEGTRFTRAYTPCPICVPARAALATGRYVHEIRFWDNAIAYDGSVRSWAHRLRDAGHRVGAIGKLHYRSQSDDGGFSDAINNLQIPDGAGDVIGLVRKGANERGGARKYAREIGPKESTYTKYDRDIARLVEEWLGERAAKPEAKPWMLFVGFVMPHFPLYAPPEFYEMYPTQAVPAPRLSGAQERIRHPFLQEMTRILPFDKYFDDETRRVAIASYFGMVSLLDHHVGKLMGALTATGLDANTRVIYASDHGEMLGNHGMWGKMCFHEESVGVPLIVRGDGVSKGVVEKAPVSLLDLYPTFLDALGLPLDSAERRELPGKSLFAQVRDPDEGRVVFSEYHAACAVTGSYMIRKGKWKYIHYVGMTPQLFDLDADPVEANDLGESPAHAAVRQELERELRRIVDPEKASALAFADQAAMLDRHGGKEEVLKRGDYGYSPAPGEKPQLEWVTPAK
ncbi:MAG: sulfatase-like hydrolase/transferase [Casimicrobiaceae bacterium]